jgi:hypothetical protein
MDGNQPGCADAFEPRSQRWPVSCWRRAPWHGGAPKGEHEFHVVVAVFDAATNVRVTDAAVTAKVSALGLSGPQKALEPMKIANTTTYGAFFNLSPDLYTIKLTVQRPGSQPVGFDFKYDHRR